MSGGSYDYAYARVTDFADSLTDVGGCGDYAATPEQRRAFAAHCSPAPEADRTAPLTQTLRSASFRKRQFAVSLTKE